jgi:glyoxylase-like metal-dependent hydrolase (beta-lactamase superfamily II)
LPVEIDSDILGNIKKMNFGGLKIYSVSDGFFRLDGGAMFGIVPRVLWEKKNPPDEKNRILLSLTPLLIITGDKKILVDTGIGGKWNEKFLSIYAVSRRPTLIESLERLKISVNDIDMVINTHLHWDHAGGNTEKASDGTIRPTFPRAKYIVQKGEWEEATNLNERIRASYNEEDFLPIKESGQLELVVGNTEIEDGIELVKIPGHNRHFQTVIISSNGRKAVYLGDLIPTATHLSYPYIMGYDLFPLETLDAKKGIIAKAAEEGWLLIFEHDPKVRMGYVAMEGGKPRLKKVIEE